MAEYESNSQYSGRTKGSERIVDHGHIKLTKSLGGGGFGKVYEAKNIQIEDGKLYAIKEIPFFDSTEEKNRVTREVKALAQLDHSNIVRYYRSWFEESIGNDSDAEHDDSSNIESSTSSGWPVQPFSSNCGPSFQESNTVPEHDEYTREDDFSVRFQDTTGPLASSRKARHSSKQSTQASRMGEGDSKLQTAAKDTAETERGVECCDKSNYVATATGKSREVADEHSSAVFGEPHLMQSRRRLLLFIQMELCAKGTLKMYLQQRPSEFDRRNALEIFCQTAKAVEYIHSKEFIHRDLKPSNIFFADDHTVKIGDFGLVTTSFGWCSHGTNADIAETSSAGLACRSSDCRKHTDDVGTKLYMSPEQEEKKPYNEKVDIYALGLVFFELMYHFSTEMERRKTLEDVRKQLLPERFEIDYPEESTFIQWLLEPDPTKRPNILEICDSKCLVTLKSKICGCSAEDNPELALSCSFCQQILSSPRLVRSHLASRSHAERVASDDDKSWLFRNPPNGIREAECVVCDRSRSGKDMCRFGDQCVQAHSDEERQEWKTRIEYRIEKALRAQKEAEVLLKRAGPPDLAERMGELLDTEDCSSVLQRSLEGVDIKCNTEFHVTKACKKCEHCWEFKISTALELQGVALRKNDEEGKSSYFCIAATTCESGATDCFSNSSSGEICREWSNSKQLALTRTGDDDQFAYTVKIIFKTQTFGSFHDYVAFSFGELNDSAPPFVVRELRVDVKAADIQQKQIGFRHANGSRWDVSNPSVLLVPFDARSVDDVMTPLNVHNSNSAQCYLTDSYSEVVQDGLKKENYKDFFHVLLSAEQLDQDEAIARYNLCTNLRICRFYEAAVGGIRYCSNGELFAKAELGTLIHGDSFEGRLLRQTVTCVYLAPLGNRTEVELPEKVYEAIIEETGKKWILLRLSRLIVQECKLSDGMIANFQVQFSPYSKAFNDLHWAVDALSSVSIVFPNVEQVNGITAFNSVCAEQFVNLNKEQLKAISCISRPRNETLPPILLLGPFGTGKTFTLAKAALYVASSDPDARILLCTHSNSAADIYVRDYFDPAICQLDASGQSKPSSMLVRIYYANRRPNTVDPVTLKYCLCSRDGYQSFRMPTIDDLKSSRFVISTLMAAKYLSDISLQKDFFTHIFIDEAAQAMEPEALIPLALATSRTRIVLAGDHMQMNPEIFSSFAASHCLHMSLIERLHDLYTLYTTNNDCRIKIMLCENYRSHTDIVKFASKTFYGGSLKASGKQAAHSFFSPLCFFNVEGTDEPSYGRGNLGYYNNNEVLEVADVIEDILKSWPTDMWGTPCEENIGVVAPYTEQVYRIRFELRKRKRDKVSVERVFNVQGKQFRVLVISTVRTSKTCSESDIGDKCLNYAFLTDSKLLNTALTRAQSLVAVVGDAKSLCSVGRCRTIWNAYIETCSKSGSLNGVVLNQIQGHLLGLDTERTRKIKNNEPSKTVLPIPIAVTPPVLLLPEPVARSPVVQGHHFTMLPIADIPHLPGTTADITSYGLHARMPLPTVVTPPQVAAFMVQPPPYLQAVPLNTVSSTGMPPWPFLGQPVHGNLSSPTAPTYVESSQHPRTNPPVTMPYGAFMALQQQNSAQCVSNRGDAVTSPSSALSSPYQAPFSDTVLDYSRMPQQFPEHNAFPPEPDALPMPLSSQSSAQLQFPNLAGSFPRPPIAWYVQQQQVKPYVFVANPSQWQASHWPGHTAVPATEWPSWYYATVPPPTAHWASPRPTNFNARPTQGMVRPPPGFAPLPRSQFSGESARVQQRSSLRPRTWTGDTPAEAPIRPVSDNNLANNGNSRTLRSSPDQPLPIQPPSIRPSTPVRQSYAQASTPNRSGAKTHEKKRKEDTTFHVV